MKRNNPKRGLGFGFFPAFVGLALLADLIDNLEGLCAEVVLVDKAVKALDLGTLAELLQ